MTELQNQDARLINTMNALKPKLVLSNFGGATQVWRAITSVERIYCCVGRNLTFGSSNLKRI